MSQLADVNTQSTVGMFHFVMTYMSCCVTCIMLLLCQTYRYIILCACLAVWIVLCYLYV